MENVHGELGKSAQIITPSPSGSSRVASKALRDGLKSGPIQNQLVQRSLSSIRSDPVFIRFDPRYAFLQPGSIFNGSQMLKAVPWDSGECSSSRLFIAMRPLCLSMIPFEIQRPSPVPVTSLLV